MHAGFHQLKVSKLTRETKDAVSLEFEVPSHLQNEFRYTAGQYLTFSITIDGEEVRRSYSVCSSPLTSANPVIAVKEVPGGKMSTYLNREVKEGDVIEVMPPMGKFTVIPDSSAANTYFLFGGGSGITPLLSIIKTVLFAEPQSKITLFYANRDKESIIFHQELEELAAKSDNLKVIYSLDNPAVDWMGYRGYLTESSVSEIVRTELGLNYPIAKYFTCGPSPMMDVVVNGLESAGVRKENIFTEYFTAATKKESSEQTTEVSDDGSDEIVERTIKVEVFGKQKDVTVKPEQTILIAAQDAGMDPPYSCTVGVCTTCRARLRSGRASMEEREGLSDAEIDLGYILTCQAHPLSDDVDLIYE